MVILQIISAIFGLLMLVVGIGAAIDPGGESKRRQNNSTYRTFGLDTHIPPRSHHQITEQTSITLPANHDDTNIRDNYWGLISFAYQKLKQTSIYKQWRYEQFDCQFGKCGICGKPMDRRYTQLDHIKARYEYGTNYSDNLILVHPKCNENKGTNTGARPDWVKENPYSDKFDKKAWEVLQDAHKDFPDEVPVSMLKPPSSDEIDYNTDKEEEEELYGPWF